MDNPGKRLGFLCEEAATRLEGSNSLGMVLRALGEMQALSADVGFVEPPLHIEHRGEAARGRWVLIWRDPFAIDCGEVILDDLIVSGDQLLDAVIPSSDQESRKTLIRYLRHWARAADAVQPEDDRVFHQLSSAELRVRATPEERELSARVAEYVRDHAKNLEGAYRWLDRAHSNDAVGSAPDIYSPFRRMMSAVNEVLRRKDDWLEPKDALGFAVPTGSDLIKLRIKAHRVLLVFWLISDPQSEWTGGPFEREGKDLMADRSCVWAMLRDDQREKLARLAETALELGAEPETLSRPDDLLLVSDLEEQIADVLTTDAGRRLLSSTVIAERLQEVHDVDADDRTVRKAIEKMRDRGWPIEGTSKGCRIPPSKRHRLPSEFRRPEDS